MFYKFTFLLSILCVLVHCHQQKRLADCKRSSMNCKVFLVLINIIAALQKA